MRSARSVASGRAVLGRATALGREASSASMVGRGSMAMPRMAVVSAAGAASGLKRAGREVWAEKVPRRRKMAEGLSLESLAESGAGHGGEERRRSRGDVHAEELEALAWPVEVHGCAVAIGERHCAGKERVGRVYVSRREREGRTCAEEEDAYVVDGLCIGKLEYGMGVVYLLQVGLQQTACDTAAEHRYSQADAGEASGRRSEGPEQGAMFEQLLRRVHPGLLLATTISARSSSLAVSAARNIAGLDGREPRMWRRRVSGRASLASAAIRDEV